MHIYFINFFINILKIFYVPIIIPFRVYVREYVYNYLIKSKTLFLFPYDITLNNYTAYCHGNNYYLKYKKTNKYIFYFYYWFFWVWYDDETYDNINLIKLYELTYKYKWLGKLLNKDLKEVNKLMDKTSFNCVYHNFNPSRYALLLYISIILNNNNYYNLNFFSNKITKIHTKLKVKNYRYIYKAK